MTPRPKDKRKFRRIQATIATDLRKEGSEAKKGCVTDLSAVGMGFESEADFDDGAEVTVTFRVPVSLKAKVVRREKSGLLKKYGVRFLKLTEAEKHQLEKYMSEKTGG